MELFPIIYTSLLIAAGLFILTVIISYVSYKVKQNKNTVEEDTLPRQNTVKHSQSPPSQPKPYKKPRQEQYQKPKEKRRERTSEKPQEKRIEQTPEKPKEKQRYEEKQQPSKRATSETRIAIVKELSPGKSIDTTDKYEKEVKDKEKEQKKDDIKDRKKLKSIDDDPLNKYSDSSDDDLHPLRADE